MNDYNYSINASEIRSIQGGNGVTKYGKDLSKYISKNVIRPNSKITVTAKGKRNKILMKKEYDSNKKGLDSTISRLLYNSKLEHDGKIQTFFIDSTDKPSLENFMDGKSDFSAHKMIKEMHSQISEMYAFYKKMKGK
jgi:ABC-type Zn2+ transport system substrate-binding protein/surface adhesin